MRWFIIIALVCSIGACATNKHKTVDSQTQKVHLSEVHKEKKDFRLYSHYSDSTQSILELLIEPQGYFSYNLTDGFGGEAKNVLLRETKLIRKQNDTQTHLQQVETLNSEYQQADNKLSTTKTVKKNYQTAWCVIFAIAILFLIWLNYSDLRSFWKEYFKN